MNRSDLLGYLIGRLVFAGGQDVISADDVRHWPEGALAALLDGGILQRMPPARAIECNGCERNCFKEVHVRLTPNNRGAAAFITCDEPEDFGRITVELARLEQWQGRPAVAASELAQALDCPIPPDVGKRVSKQAARDAAIKAKYAELMDLGQRNFVKDIRRAVPGADKLTDKRIRDIAKGR